jgi:hypothetical protein
MATKILILLLSLTLLSGGSVAYAQPITPENKSTASAGPRRHLANIVFAGLAGAVLGLSTLSFYGRPQDRLSNIAVGFAVGVIGGTIFSTYKAAAEPREFYGFENRFDYRPQQAPMAAYRFEF